MRNASLRTKQTILTHRFDFRIAGIYENVGQIDSKHCAHTFAKRQVCVSNQNWTLACCGVLNLDAETPS